MTCAQAHHVVEQAGNVVLYSGQYRYNLYHSDGETCHRLLQTQQAAFVAASDTPSCFIGYTCESPQDIGGSTRR